MPSVLASGPTTCFHYRANVTPPADYGEWEALIRALTQHLVERYGLAEVRTWFFEVWNEPNLQVLLGGHPGGILPAVRARGARHQGGGR